MIVAKGFTPIPGHNVGANRERFCRQARIERIDGDRAFLREQALRYKNQHVLGKIEFGLCAGWFRDLKICVLFHAHQVNRNALQALWGVHPIVPRFQKRQFLDWLSVNIEIKEGNHGNQSSRDSSGHNDGTKHHSGCGATG